MYSFVANLVSEREIGLRIVYHGGVAGRVRFSIVVGETRPTTVDDSMGMNDAVEQSAPVIELSSVVKWYGDKQAVKGLTLKIQPGELFAFLGPNGAGKTTTIKMIAGLLEPTSGDVRVCGHPMGSNGLPAKAQLAYVPDQPFLYEKLTGREFLYFVAEMYGMSVERRDAVMEHLVDRLDIESFLDLMAGTYSHGMKQRVVLAAALLHEPRVLIIDEPMVGLDPRTVRAVKEHFTEMTRGGATVFMSTHTLGVAEAVADRIGIIHLGELVAIGTLEELREQMSEDHSLEDIFLQHTDFPTRLSEGDQGGALKGADPGKTTPLLSRPGKQKSRP